MVLMVRLFWVFFFLGFGLAVSAQDDPVLMRINGKEVFRSEFERSYNKGGTSVGAGRKALDAYVNKFIDFRLKIEAAEVAGLDTSRVFQKEQDEYRRCLIKSYLTDEETAEQEARQYYDKMKSVKFPRRSLRRELRIRPFWKFLTRLKFIKGMCFLSSRVPFMQLVKEI